MPDDAFQLVTSKKRNKTRKGSELRVGAIHSLRTEDRIASKESLVRRIKSAQQEIASSDFYSSLLASFEESLSLIGKPKVKEIICYGLGHFADCVVSRYQLGLLLALKEQLCASVVVHDPVFDGQECDLLTALGCRVIIENEEGRRPLTQPTLAYFPHCPRQLTNNFLWANWSAALTDCVLLSNSLSSTVESVPSRYLAETVYVQKAADRCREIAVSNVFRHGDVFNDTALHVFPALLATDWLRGAQPAYAPGETELVSASLVAALPL